MKIISYIPHLGIFCLSIFLLFSCQSRNPYDIVYQGDRENDEPQLDPPSSLQVPDAQPLSPQEALASFSLVEGFDIELVAHEPMVQAPVDILFDRKGRMWVLEMFGYMADIDAIHEEDPTGRILILEDTDQDGKMDQETVFLDSLVLPRAFCLWDSGLLYATPPNLWYVKIEDDKPGEKVLVDSVYAVGGNVEHQPNSLLMALDNWIYSAKGRFRYREVNGKWLKEETSFRGQWGISQDDRGRLFYNTNSSQLRGDWVAPGYMVRNPDFQAHIGVNRSIVHDQRTYPSRITPGVNRGYRAHVLGDDWKLKNFTSACGPLIYRGDQYPEEYYGNAFVAEPAAHLIKYNLLAEKGARIRGRQAYYQKEFLTSPDERFRPVTLKTGPDGAMYIVDMYRGILQHKTYMTGYLRRQVEARGLDKHINLGRIYRVTHNTASVSVLPSDLSSLSDKALILLFQTPNAWHRETAQRLLIERNNPRTAADLKGYVNRSGPRTNIHALWTLEGMGKLDWETLRAALYKDRWPEVQAQAVRLSEAWAGSNKETELIGIFRRLAQQEDAFLQLQIVLSLGNFSSPTAQQLFETLAQQHQQDPLFREAVLTGLSGKAEQFARKLPEADLALWQELTPLLDESLQITALDTSTFDPYQQKVFQRGKNMYNLHCSGCHHVRGKGQVPLAPPLAGSSWVTGKEEALILITLFGMEGPVVINGKTYQPPAIQAYMPGIAENRGFSDEAVAAVLSYVRNAWGNDASFVEPMYVKEMRKTYQGRSSLFTQKELEGILDRLP